MTNIVVIGAGYAGVLTTKKLEKRLRKQGVAEQTQITLIDKHPYHTMLTELHEVAACRVEEESIKMNLDEIFAGRKVKIVLDTVTEIAFEDREVVGEQDTYHYDYLVLAAGSKPTYFGVEGAEKYTYPFWSYDDAVALRDRIHDCFRRAADEPSKAKRRELLSFYVTGAGFTGVELAGELADYIPILCRRFHVKQEEVTLANVDGMPRPVPIFPEKLSGKVERRLKKKGVQTIMDASVVKVGEKSIWLQRGDEVKEYVAGTVVWTAGIESADVTTKVAEELESTGRGRILVDAYLRSVDDERVYVVGDNMMYTVPGQTKPVPQMVENAEASADTAANNIVSAITGKGKTEEYMPAFHGAMVSVGGRYGVARLGTAKHQINLPSFLAMFTKHFINVVYFIQVMGWAKVLSYVKHEFFTIRNNRSFLGGHFSNRTPSFLMVPLRVWLGAVWLFEGVMKIVEGWFKKPMLTGFFGGANAWYDSILKQATTETVSSAVDAVASATGAAAGATEAAASGVGTILMNWNFGLFHTILVSGKDLASSALGDYAFKLDVPLMNWFVNNVVLANDGIQMFMQIVIVLLELAVGAGLMLGLFTFPSAAVSLVLQFMFVCTTGLYLNGIWMVFAAIAVLIGGGYTLGLDYYVGPSLKKHWKNMKWIKRWYLYND
ncbi:MAG: NAD(P)/FAD-dependent oxidoreductase [Roseburia sp.]|nr:NAD(P)/FAD-dependent oxidoreductase [Roseburia sp.]